MFLCSTESIWIMDPEASAPVLSRKCPSQSRQCSEFHLTCHLLLPVTPEEHEASPPLAFLAKEISTWSPKNTPPPNPLFPFFVLLAASQPTSPLPADSRQLPFFLPTPLTNEYTLQFTAKKPSPHLGCPSMGTTPAAPEFPVFLTGLIKVNHLWQTAILHQREQGIHCQSDRALLQLQLLSSRISLQGKKKRF